MIRAIRRFPLHVVEHQIIKIPGFGEMLSVGEHQGQVCVWCEIVERDHVTATRSQRLEELGKAPIIDYTKIEFAIVGTGQQTPYGEGWKFIDTVLDLELHVYWRAVL